MNGAIKELEELFSTKAKGNTVYFNDVCYTPLPLPVQNAVKLIMDEYPDLRYRMGLYSVTVFDKGQSIKSSRRAIKSGMTFEQAVNEFTADGKPWGDYWSMQQDWMAFVDGLERDGYVDYEESKEWVNPCTPETFKKWIRSSRRIQSRVTSEGSYSIFVDGTQASNEYPKPGNPVEFESEKDAKGSSLYKRLLDRYGQDHVQVIQESRSISSSGAFRDRDEDDNPECIIEILKDGKWEGVGIDKNADDGWSTDVNFTVFESEDKARKSGMARRVKNAGYSEEDGTLKFSTK